MKRWTALLLAGALCATLLAGCASGPRTPKLDPKKPQLVTIWHYYNGNQKQAFSALVNEFNTTVGQEKGIAVQEFSQASVVDLENSVMDSANKKVGAAELPNIFAAYADTAYAVDQMGLLADLSQYLSKEEADLYMDSYLEEGRFSTDGSLKIFPVAKSTEIFMLNQTDWDKFAADTGAVPKDFSTMEGLVKTARAYYEWTDAKTPDVPDDGQAFYGRDAFANYMLIGARQMGVELFGTKDGKAVLNFDKATVRRLWDCYYVPFIHGWFKAENRFRSDDVKVGNVIAFTGSSSGATFFPKERIVGDTESYPVEMQVYTAPQFEGGKPFAVQQGAGMVVTKSTDEAMYASVEFLRWFTDNARNVDFSLQSGYLPVTKQGNDLAFMQEKMAETGADEQMRAIVETAIETTSTNTLYTTKAFAGGAKARSIMEYSMPDKAAADRAAILELVAGGTPMAEAVAQFDNDETFDAWYNETLQLLQELIPA